MSRRPGVVEPSGFFTQFIGGTVKESLFNKFIASINSANFFLISSRLLAASAAASSSDNPLACKDSANL